jgi:hypothetical protein
MEPHLAQILEIPGQTTRPLNRQEDLSEFKTSEPAPNPVGMSDNSSAFQCREPAVSFDPVPEGTAEH